MQVHLIPRQTGSNFLIESNTADVVVDEQFRKDATGTDKFNLRSTDAMKKTQYYPNSSVFLFLCITPSNMIIKYFSKLLRPPMAAMDVGADIIELHLGVGTASVGLKLTFYVISKESGLDHEAHSSKDSKIDTWTLET